MSDFDVIVAGAGTGGAVTAYTVAKRGHSVLLVDRKTKEGIGKKTCGDALAAHHPRTLRDLIGLPEIPDRIVEHSISGIDLISPDREHRLRLEGPTIEGFSFNRVMLGQWLLTLAEREGAEVMPSTRVKELLFDEGTVSGVSVRSDSERKDREIRGRVIVDATGATGMLRRQLPQSTPIERHVEKQDMMVAWRSILETPEYEFETPNILEIYWDQVQTLGGYTWVFPRGSHRVNVGLGLLTLPGHRGPREVFDSFVRTNWDFMETRLVNIDTGGGIAPMRRPIDTLVDDNFMLVGDAACQVNPVHGGGIGPSILGGALAGISASDALERNDTSIESLWPYNTRYMESYGVKQAALDIFKVYLLSVTNDEINFAFKKGIIKGSDLLSVSVTGEMKTGKGEKFKRLASGLGNVSFLKRVSEVSKLMTEMRAIYADYPKSPKQLSAWRSRLLTVYEAVRNI
ncbi:MAG: geranylgeranyl reductase family protein [Promethearchaeota archaeon]